MLLECTHIISLSQPLIKESDVLVTADSGGAKGRWVFLSVDQEIDEDRTAYALMTNTEFVSDGQRRDQLMMNFQLRWDLYYAKQSETGNKGNIGFWAAVGIPIRDGNLKKFKGGNLSDFDCGIPVVGD